MIVGSVGQAKDGLGVVAQLKDEMTAGVLELRLSAVLIDGSVLRMYINDKESTRGRFEATEALVDNVPSQKITLDSQSHESVTGRFGNARKFVLTFSPFRIDVYERDRILVSGNQRNMLKFEQYRPRQEGEENSDGQWEETYKSTTDSKPYGPMSVGMDFSFINYEHVYGIPEHADSFSLRNTKGATDPYRLFNLDVFEYETNNPMALYGSVPMMVAHSVDSTVGLLWLNAAETWVDIESSDSGSVAGLLNNLVSGDQTKSRQTHWMSETGVIDVYFMTGPSAADVMLQNARLVGATPLPPYYSIGYHQCRWNYYTQEEVAEVDSSFDAQDIPVDAIWLDVEYTEGRSKKYFTWDPVAFSNHRQLIGNLTSKGRRLITIIDPHIKRDSNYPVYNEGVENNYFVKTKDGNDYDGWCWPGSSSWPDYFNPAVRKWWESKFAPEFFPGFEGGVVDIWNDMNEPSVFSGPEVTCPKDVKHFGDWENRDVHNIYGMLMTKATFNGLVTYRPNLRPFILTRAFFVGSQRYCAAWTGDNMAKWDHMKATIPMILSLSVVGMTFSGADVPGFFYNPEEELVIRWYQAAIFHPFFRAHGHIDTKRREPYLYPEATMKLLREALRTRYVYLPLMYTLFHENEVSGMPVMRPLWFHFPHDLNSFSVDESYLLGDCILVHPVTDAGATHVDVYFPGDESVEWLWIATNEKFYGGKVAKIPVTMSSMPFFHLTGKIVPTRRRVRRSAALTLGDPITLEVVLDSSLKSTGHLYLDDGYTYNYRTNEDYIEGSFSFESNVLRYK